MLEKGLVHIYTGDGKGKTTAAIGLSIRAAGTGNRVLFAQFLKGADTGELEPLKAAGIKILRTDVKKFVPYMTSAEVDDCKKQQHDCLEAISEIIGDYDLVVLDEVIGAVCMRVIEQKRLVRLICEKPPKTELVLTGRDAPESLIALADYVSEIRCVKHPYNKGIKARRGIEY